MLGSTIRIQSEQRLWHRAMHINWGLVLVIILVASVGFLALYSAAGGSFDPWASRQMVRFFLGVVAMLAIALVDIKWWYRLAWPAYFISLILLVIVEIMGVIGMGAQRWIDLGIIQLQPSELMKLSIV